LYNGEVTNSLASLNALPKDLCNSIIKRTLSNLEDRVDGDTLECISDDTVTIWTNTYATIIHIGNSRCTHGTKVVRTKRSHMKLSK